MENTYAEDGKQLVATYPYGKKDRGTTYSYHGDGSLKAVTDSLKRTTTIEYANQTRDTSLLTPLEKRLLQMDSKQHSFMIAMDEWSPVR
ncbi:hypothetical protein [Brevibacillus laterosporus]|uniref:hypothetical protein n=1 Tax=Brevibacillus laterosporus TaxID=1465 RepID=UPI003D256BA6